MDMLPEGLTATDPEGFNCYIPDRARRNGIDTLGGYFRSTRKRANKHLDDPVKGRHPIPCLDASGVAVLAVPCDQQELRFIQIDPPDWVEMQEGGLVGLIGIKSHKGNLRVRTYPPMVGRGRAEILVGRWILDLPDSQEVRFLDGDPTNLRRVNLAVRSKANSTPRRGESTREWASIWVARWKKAVAEGITFDREGTKT
jgi:hypothetical protein